MKNISYEQVKSLLNTNASEMILSSNLSAWPAGQFYYYNESELELDTSRVGLAKLLADEAREAYIEYAIEGISLTVVSCLGLIGNCSSILALTNISIGKTFANLLR